MSRTPGKGSRDLCDGGGGIGEGRGIGDGQCNSEMRPVGVSVFCNGMLGCETGGVSVCSVLECVHLGNGIHVV